MQSQYEDFSECGDCCTGYGVLDICWMGAFKIMAMEQYTVERMGKEWQGQV